MRAFSFNAHKSLFYILSRGTHGPPTFSHAPSPLHVCREFKREEQDIRMSIMPFLQAETDVKAAFLDSKRVENEAELMKDVPNWEAGASVYKTRSYMAPMVVFGANDYK